MNLDIFPLMLRAVALKGFPIIIFFGGGGGIIREDGLLVVVEL